MTKWKKSWKFQGVGEVMQSPLERKIQWGGGVKLEKNPPWGGVWIFSGTTHGMVISFSINYEQQTSYLLFVHMLIFVVP